MYVSHRRAAADSLFRVPESVIQVSSHGGDAAADWVVCRIFRRARPAHRARLGGGAREELEEEHAAEESPSSCVTDASETLDQEEDDGDEGSSSSTVASSN